MGLMSQPMLSSVDQENAWTHRWGVILAGGDGKRLLPLTRRITGDDRPKQFCPIFRGETLLDQTRSRVGLMVRPRQTLLVVTETHERFYALQSAVSDPSRLLIQPWNKGTTPAILYSLLTLRELDPNAVVGFFPSDHHFASDDAFVDCIDSAFETVDLLPQLILLLGIVPTCPEVDYGWIQPGPSIAVRSESSVFRVSRFWEKPSFDLAVDLKAHGCLWNSFVMVGRVDSFIDLVQRALPYRWQCFQSIRSTCLSAVEREALLDLYASIPAGSFSEEVLSAYPSDFAMISSANLGWSDMGDPARVLAILDEAGSALNGTAELTFRNEKLTTAKLERHRAVN